MPFQHYRTMWQMSNAGVVEQKDLGLGKSVNQTTSSLRRWPTWCRRCQEALARGKSSRNRLRWHVNR